MNNLANLLRWLYNKIKNNPIIIELVVFGITGLLAYIFGFFQLPKQITEIKTEIATSEETMNKHIEDSEKNIGNVNERIDELYSFNSKNGNKSEITINIDRESIEAFSESQSNIGTIKLPLFKEYSILLDENGNEHTATDLVERKMIISYIENGQEVFFCGQFDQDIKWDGDCLINVYKNNKLIIATSTEYKNGKQESYHQFFSNNGEWIYAERICEEGYNSGDTWKYAYTKDYLQNISFDDPSESDMLTPSNFRDELCESLTSRYHGYTTDGEYNDSTGKAYLISFSNEGTVKTLYHGNFKDGNFHDDTGHAWYITRDDKKDTDYMYYMGKFIGGHPVNDENSYFENPISRATFNRLISNKIYDCYMNWEEQYVGN